MNETQLRFFWNPCLDSWHTVLVDKIAKNKMYLHIPAEEKEKADSGQLGLWSKTSKMLKSGIVCSLFRPDSSSQYKHSTKTTDSDHCHRLEAIRRPSPSPNLLLLKQHWNHSSFDFPTIQSTTPLASLFYHVIIIIISALPFILKNNTTWRVRQALVFHPKVHAFWGRGQKKATVSRTTKKQEVDDIAALIWCEWCPLGSSNTNIY